MAKWNIDKLCRPKKYMGQIMAECDCRSQLCEDRGHCMAATPSPEALVKAALERAARGAELFTGAKHTAFDIEAGTFPKQSYLGDAIAAEIRALADDPEAVAQIIKKAGEDWG